MRTIVEILKASATPPSIIYPIFLAPLAIFSLEASSPIKLIEITLFSATFQSAVNLWNHVNDVEEDLLAGREWVIVRSEEIRKAVGLLAGVLYVISGLMVYFWQRWEHGIIFYLAAFFATWFYSDNLVAGKFIRRLKEHYVTETLTYLITIPSYSLTVWSMLSTDLSKGFAISLTFLFLMLSATLLKDLKDISTDKEAGFFTLGVAFHYKTLLRLSYLFVFLFYTSIGIFVFIGIYPGVSIISILPVTALGYSAWNMHKKNWEVDNDFMKFLKLMIFSTLLSLVLFSSANIIFT